MNPLVSILVPAFNAEEWISGTIESALAQTWTRKEIIIVDDGSTDQTLAISRRFASREVSVIAQENQGAAAARNKAFSICQGDYIQWLDADDLLAREKIAKQVEALADCLTKRTLFSSAWGQFMYRPHRARFNRTRLWRDLAPLEWLCLQMEHLLFMHPASWLVSRELSEAAGSWDTRLTNNDDGEYFCRVVLASDYVRFVPEARSYYRRLGVESLSSLAGSGKKLESLYASIELTIAHTRRFQDNEATRVACLRFLQHVLIFFYSERPDLVERLAQLATRLGGQLEPPRLPWKYAWLHRLFGWACAKRTQLAYNRSKSSLLKFWDKALLHAENLTSMHNAQIG